MDTHASPNVPIACDLGALGPDVRATHLEAARQLLSAEAAEVQELPNGYAFRYPAAQYDQVAQFVANERLCCPFFTFALEVTPAQGPIWLRVIGDAEVKQFLQAELRRGES